MNKKIMFLIIMSLILLILVIFSIGEAFGANVTDNNKGNQGYILVNDGSGQGHRGVWTDPTFLKGAKGDTGATGPQGIQGIQGLKGDKGDIGSQGIQGVAGKDGLNGTNGINGTNGVDGVKGAKGDKGDKGDTGLTGADGKDVDPTIVNNLQDEDTKLSDTINTKDITQTNWNNKQDQSINNINSTLDNHDKRINKLEETQYNVRGELILQQGRRHKIGTYTKYNTNRNTMAEVGLSITVALDDSYEMKEIENLNSKIERLQRTLETQNIKTETVKNGNKTTIRIIQKEGLIKLMNRF